MLHAGGWFMGDLENEKLMCKILCHRLNIVMINVGYRLYPEVDFPVPITDCQDVVKWLSAHATELDERIDLSKGFVIGGSSGGSTYAAIVCHLARDDGIFPPLTGCYLACPIFGDAVRLEGNKFDDNMSIFGPGRNKSKFQHANQPITDRKTETAIRGETPFGGQMILGLITIRFRKLRLRFTSSLAIFLQEPRQLTENIHTSQWTRLVERFRDHLPRGTREGRGTGQDRCV